MRDQKPDFSWDHRVFIGSKTSLQAVGGEIELYKSRGSKTDRRIYAEIAIRDYGEAVNFSLITSLQDKDRAKDTSEFVGKLVAIRDTCNMILKHLEDIDSKVKK